MTQFSAKKIGGESWEIWEHTGGFKRQVCTMRAEDVLGLFNTIVPMEVREDYMIGNPECKHSWRTWKFNPEFVRCSKCPAMQKIKRLVPSEYE